MKNMFKSFFKKQIEEITENKLVNSWIIHLLISCVFLSVSGIVLFYGCTLCESVNGKPVIGNFWHGVFALIITMAGGISTLTVWMGSTFAGLFGFRWQHRLYEHGLWPEPKNIKEPSIGGVGSVSPF